ncbi:hypothetical protein [Flavobacterium sp. N3904]|uniref:hypothetical protein n=1 Tax=Flavobacterium sp. N3904 TaxID=2986835 RepID=UPI002224CDDC|nr:hypothetical protein [Flavobacterium sp. N3904]
MNDAHLHLIVNHFPIIGTILGLGILIVGMILKNISVKNTAYILFLVSAIFAAFSMGTGEGAEEMVEDMPNIGKQIIHEHEELAEKLALVLYLLGAISLVGLFLNYKKNAKTKYASYAALIVAIIGVFIAKEVGTSGGEIRHTEIRANASALNSGGAEKNATTEESREDND